MNNLNVNENEEVYRLTTKGFLATKLAEKGLSFDEVDSLWEKLKEFVLKQAEQNQHPKGVPALIFKDGGYCATVFEDTLEEFPEEIEV
ncbi:MAG TPA: hypothetical protein PLP33_25355 [Leptospiraceae bacterium]|nr:hypothetical protein [Leptospiraceae bacterium]